MIEQQVRPWDIVDLSVLNAMQTVPRERFVPEIHQALAFADTALPIGHGQLMFKPVLEARLLQALNLQTNDEVLEIGTGSGYLSACLASLCRSVTSIDLHAEFVTTAKQKLAALDLNNVRFVQADALQFDPQQQFDAILVGAALIDNAERFVPLLRLGGRLVVVVGQSPAQEAVCITRTENGFTSDSLFETDIPYLIGAAPVAHFSL
jgi:protein-L-isoaspartate(D-aspartate) O-methyltransferase